MFSHNQVYSTVQYSIVECSMHSLPLIHSFYAKAWQLSLLGFRLVPEYFGT